MIGGRAPLRAAFFVLATVVTILALMPALGKTAGGVCNGGSLVAAASTSSVAIDRSSLPADQTAVLTVRVRDADGCGIYYGNVEMKTSTGLDVIRQLNGNSTLNYARFTLAAAQVRTPGSYSYTIYYSIGPQATRAPVLLGSGTVTFTAPAPTPAPPSAANSSITLVPSSLDVSQTAALTVTIRDGAGSPLAGEAVRAEAGAGQLTVTPLNSVTDSGGVMRFSLATRYPGSYALSIYDGSLPIGTRSVTFTGSAPTAPPNAPDAARSTLTLDSNNVPANQTVHLTVTLRNASGSTLSGVQVHAHLAGASFPYTLGSTDGSGSKTFSINAPFEQIPNGNPAARQPGTYSWVVDANGVELGPIAITFTAPATSAPSPASATPKPVDDESGWSADAIKYRGRNGQHFTYICPTGGPPFPVGGDNFSGVYGTDTYTDDSPVCLAAVHAGLITLSGGEVTIEIRPRADSYKGSTRNGITTIDYGTCECGSYVFAGGPRGLPHSR